MFRQQEAALSAARELEPYCKEEDTKNQMMIKQTVARAMTHIREFGPEIKDKKSAQEQDEELKRVKKEALDLYRQCD